MSDKNISVVLFLRVQRFRLSKKSSLVWAFYHIYGIRSLRQTVAEIEVNVAYRWFIGYGLTEKIPHFSTVSYNFLHRFDSEMFEEIFTLVLNEGIDSGYVKPEVIFVDSTHIKANANRKKQMKVQKREFP